MKYKTLLFDADMTLFDFKASEREGLKQTLLEHGFPYSSEILETYSKINDSYWKKFERGEVDRATLLIARFADFFREIGVSGDAEAFNRQYLENIGGIALLLDGAEELCRELSKTHRLYIITNGIARTQRRRMDKSGLNVYFDDVFISEEIGAQKPQAAFFEYVEKHIPNWDAESTLVIGDSLTSDIQGAVNYGLDRCWYNPEQLPYTLTQPCTYIVSDFSELKMIANKK